MGIDRVRKLTAIMLSVCALQANALTLNDYQSLIKKSGKANIAIVNASLDGIAMSFVTYERMVSQAFQKRLVCLPNRLQVSPRVVSEAIDHAIKLYPKRDLAQYQISELAFMGLATQYPCPN